MDYQHAVETYVKALVDVATILHIHHEARTEFDRKVLARTLHDGFLQPVNDDDQTRLLEDYTPDENFLLWYGEIPGRKMNWNCVGWIFPFQTMTEMERSYEMIIRAELAQKSWANMRQFLLSCRMKLHEGSIQIPTNIVKVRVKGEQTQKAMRLLDKSPPNLRYVAKAVADRLSPSNYFRKRTQIKIVIGEKLEPYVRTPRY
jgi:hypothetical protein